jgi:isoleucyl-tRNA synthetase
VKFKLDDQLTYQPTNEPNYLVIWTTTPWTLLANVAVAVHPDLIYAYVNTAKGKLIIAKDLLEKSVSEMGLEKFEIIKEFQGNKLEGLVYAHPFGLRKGKVVLADYVSKEDGTGLVHTAPGHGAEDYQTGLRYKLDIIMPVDSKGRFDYTTGEFTGMNVYDANKVIIEKLQGIGALLFESKVTHSYPHCWRCKNPIIFRATKQWFLSIDKDGLRDKLTRAIEKDVTWVPASGKERISAMVKLRPDWCLSRQRYWGVPVPALVCQECKEEFFDSSVIEKFSQFVAQEGTDCWFIRDIKDFLTQGLTCPVCAKGKTFSKGSDILDVWFDSGVSSQAVLKKRKELRGVPADLYLEGSDQHRGWFQSSLIPGMCIDNAPPFKTVLTHGFVVDGEGRKMSKSLGNVISPFDIIKDYGADILRMWVASSDYNEDIRISKEILTRLSEAYRKIRNTARFALSNLYDFNPDNDKVNYESLKEVDKWVLQEADITLAAVEAAYEKFSFHAAYKQIYDFCNEKLSMSYLDMIKGRLYTFAANSVERRAAQTAIYEILNLLVRMIAPILVFSAEEIWQNMPKEKAVKDITSVHLLNWPQKKEALKKEIIDFDLYVIRLIPDVAKALEEKRAKGEIGSSFDAKINLLTNDPARYTFLESLKSDLCEIFKVSQVEVKNDPAVKGLTVEAASAQGKKCVRCWNYSSAVGCDKTHIELCDNCVKAIGEK